MRKIYTFNSKTTSRFLIASLAYGLYSCNEWPSGIGHGEKSNQETLPLVGDEFYEEVKREYKKIENSEIPNQEFVHELDVKSDATVFKEESEKHIVEVGSVNVKQVNSEVSLLRKELENQQREMERLSSSFEEEVAKQNRANQFFKDEMAKKDVVIQQLIKNLTKNHKLEIEYLTAQVEELKNKLREIPSVYEKPVIEVVKRRQNAKLPTIAHPGDQFDIYAVERTVLQPGEVKVVDTGLNLSCPPFKDSAPFFTFYQTHGKSSLSKKQVTPICTGTWDNEFQGPLKFAMKNNGDEAYVIEEGAKFAQIVFMLGYTPDFKCMNFLDSEDKYIIAGEEEAPSYFSTKTSRGANGLGSTGIFERNERLSEKEKSIASTNNSFIKKEVEQNNLVETNDRSYTEPKQTLENTYSNERAKNPFAEFAFSEEEKAEENTITEKKTINKIYLDLDGVVFDFNKALYEYLLEYLSKNKNKNTPLYEKYKNLETLKKEKSQLEKDNYDFFIKELNLLNGFDKDGIFCEFIRDKKFETLSLCPEAEKGLDYLTGLQRDYDVEIKILSSTSSDEVISRKEEVARQKKISLNMKEILFDPIFVHREKQEFSGVGCLLIDDYGKNIEEWKKKEGFTIKHTDWKSTLYELETKYNFKPKKKKS